MDERSDASLVNARAARRRFLRWGLPIFAALVLIGLPAALFLRQPFGVFISAFLLLAFVVAIYPAWVARCPRCDQLFFVKSRFATPRAAWGVLKAEPRCAGCELPLYTSAA
jgi:hypothetical protein